MEPWGTIHFASGEKVHVPGTMQEIQAKLDSARGGAVLFQDRNQHDVLVFPGQVSHVVVQQVSERR
jgi:NADH:ubiquinone oxidoreductase subunit B-like Fe-S oxidoreductase